MACSLSITLVRGNPATPGGMTTSSIRVEGTVAECEPFTLDNTAPRDVVVMVDCGAGPVTVQTLSSAGIWSLGVPATCTCGTPIRVTATCATNPECTDLFSGLLECEEVDCPTGVLAVFAGDCNSSGKRIVTLMASISAAPPGSQGGWVFGDGSQGGTFPIVVGPFSETHPYTPPGPAFPAQLVFVQPPDCPPLKATIANLQPCPGGGGGDGVCLGLLITIAVAGALAILAGLLALCIPAAATVLGIIAGSLALAAIVAGALLWWFDCPLPCLWWLLKSSQILFGAGYGAVLFSKCCPKLAFAGVIMILVGLGLLLLWRQRCRVSWCDFFAEIAWIFGPVAIAIIGAVETIPAVKACFNQTAYNWISGILGFLLLSALARCVSAEEPGGIGTRRRH